MKVKIILKLLALVLCVSGLYVVPVESQTSRPLGKPELLKSLNRAKEKKLSNSPQVIQIILDEIELNGVDFQINQKDEAELRAAGANKKIIEAVRNNYRRPIPTIKPTPTPTPTPRIIPPKTGEAFNLSEIIGWLQKGALSKDLQTAVEARLVSFILEESDESQIASSGGNTDLIRTIKKSATSEVVTAYYNQLIQDAEGYVMANKWPDAEKLLAKAIELLPSQPEAFRLRGEVSLYKVTLNKDRQYAEAKNNMIEALRLGGRASFRVSYNRGGDDPYCPGRLFVKKDSFIFEGACRKTPTWDPIPDTQVVSIELGTKKWVKADKGGFTILTKIIGPDGKPLRFDFQAYGAVPGEAVLIKEIIYSY